MKRILALTLVILSSAVSMWSQNGALLAAGQHLATAGTFALSHTSPTTPGCSGSTTCSITLTSSLSANNLATIVCNTTNNVALLSVNAGGTLVPVYSGSTGNASSLFSAEGYIAVTSATAGPVVVTGTGNFGAGSTCLLREYTVSSGTPALDTAHATLNAFAAVTSVAGETTGTLSGTNDLYVANENNDSVVTNGVSGTNWVDGKFDSTAGPGWADKLNQTSSGAPTWAWTGSHTGNAAMNYMTFATNATPCDDVLFINFEGGSNTTTVTTALLTSSSFGLPVTGTGKGWSLSTSPATGLTFSSSAQLSNFHTNRRPCGTGTSSTGSGSLGVQWDLSQTTAKTAIFSFLGRGTKASVGFFWQTDISSNATQLDALSLQSSLGGSSVGITHTGGNLVIECFGGSTDLEIIGATSANTTYWVDLAIDTAVGGSAAFYETVTWTQVGTTTCAAGGWTPQPIDNLKIGQFGASGTHPANHYWYDNVVLNPSSSSLITP